MVDRNSEEVVDHRHLYEVASAVLQGDVGLWLGASWKPPSTEEGLQAFINVEWLAIWSESPERETASVLARQDRDRRRILREVPGKVAQHLGEYYSIAEFCPYFYLSASSHQEAALTKRQARIQRDLKIGQLNRLGSSVLFIDGYFDLSDATDVIRHEVLDAGPTLRMIVLTGINFDENVRKETSSDLRGRLLVTSLPLSAFLLKLRHEFPRIPNQPSIRVGSQYIDIGGIVRTDPPIDQHFSILKTEMLEPVKQEEDRHELLISLLAGRSFPWRAFAHGLDWERTPHYLNVVKSELSRLRTRAPAVTTLSIPAEAGSGLTVLLQRLAFEGARLGCATLIARPDNPPADHYLLRTFLSDLFREVDDRWNKTPAVLVFDANSAFADPHESLASLPKMLVQDGRRALIIRGVPVPANEDTDSKRFRDERGVDAAINVEEVWLPRLPASLTQVEQFSLVRWAENLEFGATARKIEEWQQEREGIPLLVALYFLLTTDLRSSAGLGKHLVERFLSPPEGNSTPPEAHRPEVTFLSGSALQQAAEHLTRYFRGAAGTISPTEPADIAGAVILLSLTSPLRIGIPQELLADLLAIPLSFVPRIATHLQEKDLASLSLTHEHSEAEHTIAPAAYYRQSPALSLRHPTYGRLILDWLLSNEGQEDRGHLESLVKDSWYLQDIDADSVSAAFPLRLLKPIFSRLTPERHHVLFAAQISASYLRLQKHQRSPGLARWQWRNVDGLLEAYTWLDEQLAQQSSVILHSRGITRYKSCSPTLDIEDCRRRYRRAVDDFERALQLLDAGADLDESPVAIKTSLGLLYEGWALRERVANSPEHASDAAAKAETTLREALAMREENPYAAFGLARFLVDRCIFEKSRLDSEQYGRIVAEAIELLQQEPEPSFRSDWEEVRKDAIQLLSRTSMLHHVRALQEAGDELGYALSALRVLEGEIPLAPGEMEALKIQQAADILETGAQRSTKRSLFADYLRYAVYTSDLERLRRPNYGRRLELLNRLVDTRHAKQPKLLYDRAMLLFQLGEYTEGEKVYSELRRGYRFFQVPSQRSVFLSDDLGSTSPLLVPIRIVRLEQNGLGWGLMEVAGKAKARVRFSIAAFNRRGKPTTLGAVTTAFIKLEAAGPTALPPREEAGDSSEQEP